MAKDYYFQWNLVICISFDISLIATVSRVGFTRPVDQRLSSVNGKILPYINYIYKKIVIILITRQI